MDLGTRKVITSRDVYFNEDKFPYCGPPADRQSTVVEESNEVMVLVPAPPSSAADADAGGAAPDGHEDAVDGVVEGGDYDDPPTPVSPEPAESSDEEVPVTPRLQAGVAAALGPDSCPNKGYEAWPTPHTGSGSQQTATLLKSLKSCQKIPQNSLNRRYERLQEKRPASC
jgi:hypothetical protein